MNSRNQRVEQLERVLAGALRAGDQLTDELARLARVNARQRNAMWRALNLIRQGGTTTPSRP
jgi:hypothetical protein